MEELEAIEARTAFVPRLLVPRLKRILSQRLGSRLRRQWVRRRATLRSRWTAWRLAAEPARPTPPAIPGLAPGDWVRVRPRAEIEATLDSRHRLRGLRFMPEMAPYCGTTRLVYKRLERFFDERERRVKRTRGLVLLKDVLCDGVAEVGRCDRACFFFWREEWLEKLGPKSDERTGSGCGSPPALPPAHGGAA